MSRIVKQYIFDEYTLWLRVWQDNAAVGRQLDRRMISFPILGSIIV